MKGLTQNSNEMTKKATLTVTDSKKANFEKLINELTKESM